MPLGAALAFGLLAGCSQDAAKRLTTDRDLLTIGENFDQVSVVESGVAILGQDQDLLAQLVGCASTRYRDSSLLLIAILSIGDRIARQLTRTQSLG
jgi:hypothetical protein